MAIDWDAVVTGTESQTDELDAAEEVDEPTVDTEERPELRLPADD